MNEWNEWGGYIEGNVEHIFGCPGVIQGVIEEDNINIY